MAQHPYRGIPDHQYWSRAVSWAPPGGLDLVVETKFTIGTHDRVGTLGSCFAQHLSRHLARSGLNYYVAETAPAGMSAADAAARQYGVFSARYGNVYTVRQALQLFQRAYGKFDPVEEPWVRGDVLVDPYRPLVEPSGFADPQALEAARDEHLSAVRDVFEKSDVLVFTLGLTEGWRSRADGAVFSTAPGVNGGSYDPAVYEFVNFGIDEVRADLIELCESLRSVNPDLLILLTVSPVPLIATFENRHVLVSTTYSKSVLRVAADEAARQLDHVDYFPSFELISSGGTNRNLYGPDLREVDELGVAHVMRSFSRHYIHGLGWAAPGAAPAVTTPVAAPAVICDEETVAAAIEAS